MELTGDAIGHDLRHFAAGRYHSHGQLIDEQNLPVGALDGFDHVRHDL